MLNPIFILANGNFVTMVFNGVKDVMESARWIIFAVGAVALVFSAIKFVQHFRNHGKGQSQLMPAIALLIVGAILITGSSGFVKLGKAGHQTLKDWETKADSQGKESGISGANWDK